MIPGDLDQVMVGLTEVRQGPFVMNSKDDERRVVAPRDLDQGVVGLTEVRQGPFVMNSKDDERVAPGDLEHGMVGLTVLVEQMVKHDLVRRVESALDP